MQGMLDSKKIPYGVQYELARFVSKGQMKFEAVSCPDLDRIVELKTNEKAAPVTYQILGLGSVEEKNQGTLSR